MDKLTKYLIEPFVEKEVIEEGARDPGIFKAIFLAGGPGSGKSFVAQKLFGIPEKINVSKTGLKMVNQDSEFELLLKKYFGTTDVDNMPDELFADLTGVNKAGKPVDYDTSGLRAYAKSLSKERLRLYTEGKLGVIIDGTGHKFQSIAKKKKNLEKLGYDCYMVFVNTSLDVAMERNEKRDRVVPASIVRKSWQDVQNNMGAFQGLFGGSNFLIVSNNKRLSDAQIPKHFKMLVSKGIDKFLGRPPKNPIAKKWLRREKKFQKVFKDPGQSRFFEAIKLPVEIGDTVLMGRFKNKKVVVKSIDYNDNGDLLINGRPALKFRIMESINESDVKAIHKFLTQNGKSASKATAMIRKYYNKVKKQFKGDSTRDLAMAIVGYDVIGENKELFKMYTQAMKMLPGSPKQKELIKKISSLRKKLKMDEEFGAPAGMLPSPSRKGVKKMKKKGNTSVPYGSGYKKINENKKIRKTIGVFGGRFQPFHSGHLATYKWLASQVDEAYITTSNIKQPPRHPMNFAEKVRHMTKMGIPKNRIVQEKTPYVADNLLRKFDPETTAVVYAFGQKDAGRLGSGRKKSGGLSYYQDYKKNRGNIKGYGEHGYFLTAPQQGSMSGTKMRDLLGNPKYDDSAREKTFRKVFGYFDKGVYNMMTNKFRKLFESYTLSDELIKEYLMEATITTNGNLDDGPSTFHKDFAEYVKVSTEWIDSVHTDAGWVVLDYIIRDGAKSSIKDAYKSVPLTYLDHGQAKGSNRAVNKYKKWMSDVIEPLGWDVVSWMGTSAAIDNLIGSVFAAGADGDSYLPNQFQVVESIKPDVINSFAIQDSLNSKIWDGHEIKPEIRKRLLIIAKNFFDGLDLESDVELKDITLTGSISNYNWSKFSDVDLHLILDFSQIDDDEEFVKNYFLAKKTNWNNEHDISIYGFPVEMYVENIGDKHFASGLYSILKDKWIVEPKKKELQIDKDDIRSKAEGYLDSEKVLKDKMKDGKYDEVIQMVDKIKAKLKRMRSSGLEKGGEFSVENLAFKALRRSPFIATISDMKVDAYDKKMSMKERISIMDEVQLLVEGGAYGHLNHPFDNKNLTFSDFKTLIINTLQGNLDKEGPVTEKTDGQNIMISWKNGKLVAARNKGHIKNFGANALDISGIRNMFSGRGDIEKAFVSAMMDLQKALSGLSKKQKDKVFAEGKKFMSLEVMYPATSNVVPYDKSLLQFHGTIEYDTYGSPIGEDRGSARMLAGMIKQINQNVQKTYSITKPFVTNLPQVKNFAQRQSYFLGKLQKLQNIYKLTDSATLGDYHQAYWMEYIYNGAKQTDNPNPSNDVLMKLTKRWAFFDKSYKIPQIRKDLKDYPKFLDWVLSTDKMDHAKLQKKHIRDWEVLFFELGAEILKNMKDFIAANPSQAAQKIRNDLTKAINQVRKSKDPKVLSTLKTQLDRLNAIGGLKAVVPSEGITFVFKGKLYKYTGAFAPANQILGMLKFV